MKKFNQIFWVAFFALALTACGGKSEIPTLKFDHLMNVATSDDSIECYAIDSTMAIPLDPNNILSDGVVAEPVKILVYVKNTRSGKKYIQYNYTVRESILGFGATNYSQGPIDTAVIMDRFFSSTNKATGEVHEYGGKNKVVELGDSDVNLIFSDEDEAVRILMTINLWKHVINYEKTLPETHSI